MSEHDKIPKVIHYIWLGNNKLDKVSLKCIATWQAILPEFQIICWDDEKCRKIIQNNLYAKEAFEARKYAFVSDYLRLYILYNYGGIYMDTDVQLLKPINRFLKHSAFTCFESKDYILSALLAAEKGNAWILDLLKEYNSRLFKLMDGNFDLTTNVISITNCSLDWGLEKNGQYQILKGDVHIYPKDYFCPLDTANSKYNCFSENTCAIHLYNGSWTPMWRRIASKIKKKLGLNPQRILGERLYQKIK